MSNPCQGQKSTAATKYRLDTNLARVFLKPFGTSHKLVMLGLMLVTAIFSQTSCSRSWQP